MSIEPSELSPIQALAKTAAKQAYAPYSQFKVGAVLLTKSGEIISGCNVENVSYGLSNCAERTAIFTAIAQGIDPQSITKVVIYTPSEQVYSPCGACRQVLAEFLAPDTDIISTCETGFESWTVASLLPHAFHFDVNEYRNKS